jgi:hypothetical protein
MVTTHFDGWEIKSGKTFIYYKFEQISGYISEARHFDTLEMLK